MTQAGEVIQEGGQEVNQEIETEDAEADQEVRTEEEEEAEVGIAMTEMVEKAVNQPEVNDKRYGTNLQKVMKILLLFNSRL